MIVTPTDYEKIKASDVKFIKGKIYLHDHIEGIKQDFTNEILDKISQMSDKKQLTVYTEYLFDSRVKNNYPNLNLRFSIRLLDRYLRILRTYNTHPELTFKNFVCSFNGTSHVSRQLLVSAMHRFKLFTEYSTKNFTYTNDQIYGHVDKLSDNLELNSKLIVSDDDFCQKIFTLAYSRFDHLSNITALAPSITSSFVHIVSETLATSYYPFFGEKNFYSIVTRGLWLSYGQPAYHEQFSKYFGFRLYDKVFNYKFDTILNPIDRLIELLTMISKFQNLSTDDWRDLYLLEQENIEYNYHHYFSGNYLINLKQFVDNEIRLQ